MDNDFIFHTEYREHLKTNLKTDFSFNRNDNDTNSHIFLSLNGKFEDDTNYNLKIENVNNDNYLKFMILKAIPQL